jgi:hypothetical protein
MVMRTKKFQTLCPHMSAHEAGQHVTDFGIGLAPWWCLDWVFWINTIGGT